MSRRKGKPAFPGKSKVTSMYLRPRTQHALKACANRINFSVSDIVEYLCYVGLPGATREALERFGTAKHDAA